MPDKIRYEIDLTRRKAESERDPRIRAVTNSDVDGLAHLMLNAYRGTIDYEGEGLDEAVAEVRSFLDGEAPILDSSLVIDEGGALLSGILVLMLDGSPFIGSIMTAPEHKRRGLARTVCAASLGNLAADGHDRVVFYITDGNLASEGLFRSLGAVRNDR